MSSKKGNFIFRELKKRWQLYLLLLVPLAYVVIFCYLPMAGLVIAFKNYSISRGIFGSEWVGLKYFKQFFSTSVFFTLLKATLSISIYQLIAGFPIPIMLALALNEVRSTKLKKSAQLITYAPYFISTVVMVSIIIQILDINTGLVNNIIGLFNGRDINFMGRPEWFAGIYVWTGVWQTAGFQAIIYIAALSGVDPCLIEAAVIDGASRAQRVRYVDLPTIKPTIVILLIMSIGRIMSIGFDKIYLMQNSVNLPVSEIISTFVYKRGLQQLQFSYASAVGLFNSIVNFALLIVANMIARKTTDSSLW